MSTLDQLKAIHSETLINDGDNENVTEQVIEALGGIDNIISYYLSSNSNLSETQINTLIHILSPNTLNTPKIIITKIMNY